MNNDRVQIHNVVLEQYRTLVSSKHPDAIYRWPVLSGANLTVGRFEDFVILYFKHTASPGVFSLTSIGTLSPSLVGDPSINPSNLKSVRERLVKHFGSTTKDAVLLVKLDMSNLRSELDTLLQQHEFVLGLIPMKIFLSHKGVDKPKVREFKQTLELLGFDPWLDEDAMHAGVELERSISQGFKDSCAAVFFVTPNYLDEQYLATEVNYAISEKRKKGAKFSIITLVYEADGKKGKVPDLLEPYVWKEPRNDLEALRELIRALPVRVNEVYWK